ncbi:MAG: aldehyde dehydrogenase family protein [Propionibacteriales bacterium]|nr:aldehyde dehydrogenase family protein [Propionibacteriales bacterium]
MTTETTVASALDVSALVADLRAAQPAWESLGLEGRGYWLRRYRTWLLDHADELARSLQEETGKTWVEANIEAPYVADVITYYLRRAPHLLGERRHRAHSPLTLPKRQVEVRRPFPVVGNITPWNFPLALSLIDVVPALIAGSAAVVKPSELTPNTVRTAIDGWAAIGAPPVLACVSGAGESGAAVVDEVDFVQFTGSTRTGRAIAQRAGERLVPYSLELGGKDPLIVLADADIERAANAAVWGAFCNAGQMCTSVERVYVEAAAYDDFLTRVVAKTRALRVGTPGPDFNLDVGPLVSDAQVEIVSRHIADAVDKGARVLVGGSISGKLVQPTVLADVDHTMNCMREETFGPTMPIMKVDDLAHAVALANDSEYGLSASVFTRDARRAREVASRLEAGAVNVNDVFANLFTATLPMSGWKKSGIGARMGDHGLLKYTRSQAVVTPRITPRRELQWYPYSRLRSGLMLRALRWAAGGLPGDR